MANTHEMTTEHFLQIVIAVIVTAITTWLLSSFNKASKKDLEEAYEEFGRQTEAVKKQIEEFEKRVVNPLVSRIDRIEAAGYVSRGELKESLNVMKELIEANQKTINSNFKTLFYEVRKRKEDDD